MTGIYRQQLETTLFSINQYAWDTVNDWAGTLDLAVIASTQKERRFETTARDFLQTNNSGRAVFVLDNLKIKHLVTATKSQITPSAEAWPKLYQVLQRDKTTLHRLKRWQNVGYRKIHSAIIGDTGAAQPRELVLIFAPDTGDSTDLLIGVILEMRQFVRSVLAPRLDQLSSAQFALAVFEEGNLIPAYATAAFAPEESVENTRLWVMPNFHLAIKSTAETIEGLAWQRRIGDLAVTIFLNICLVFIVWQLYRTVNREAQLARMKSDFVSNVSHELRTPLAMIRMFAETLELKRVEKEEKKLEYYSIIRQESERMTHLVNNILNFSKMETGQVQFPLKEESLTIMVKKVVDNYRFHLNNHGFEVLEELDEGLPPIQANEEAVSEAIINLLENAVKYSEEQREIAITTGQENGYVFLIIRDEGIGIPPNMQQAIFDKFYRVSNGLVHNTRGSGLGLTLVKHIMAEHHGDVSVESIPGEGSSFKLWFPINREGK